MTLKNNILAFIVVCLSVIFCPLTVMADTSFKEWEDQLRRML